VGELDDVCKYVGDDVEDAGVENTEEAPGVISNDVLATTVQTVAVGNLVSPCFDRVSRDGSVQPTRLENSANFQFTHAPK
jgi:hypothetical protein